MGTGPSAGIGCNMDVEFPQFCCANYINNTKKPKWEPKNKNNASQQLEYIKDEYDTALNKRDYRGARRFKIEEWRIREQIADHEIDKQLLWMALRQTALAVASEEQQSGSSEQNLQLIRDLTSDMLAGSRAISKEMIEIEQVKRSRNRGFDDADEPEMAWHDFEGVKWLVTGLFSKVGRDSVLQDTAERRGMTPGKIAVGHRQGAVRLTKLQPETTQQDVEGAAVFGQQMAQEQQSTGTAMSVVIVFRKGSYVKAYNKQDLQVRLPCAAAAELRVQAKLLSKRGTEHYRSVRPRDDYAAVFLRHQQLKKVKFELKPVWQIKLKPERATDKSEVQERASESSQIRMRSAASRLLSAPPGMVSHHSTRTAAAAIPPTPTRVVQFNRDQGGDELAFEVDNNLAEQSERVVRLRCHSGEQAAELLTLLEQDFCSYIRVSPLNTHPEPRTINEAIQLASKEIRQVIYVEPGVYKETILIDRAVVIKPSKPLAEFRGHVTRRIAVGSTDASDYVVVAPDCGPAVVMTHHTQGGATLEAAAGVKENDTTRLEDLVMHGNSDMGMACSGDEQQSVNDLAGKTAVVVYAEPRNTSSSYPLAPLRLVRCDIGFSAIGVLASGSRAQQLSIHGSTLHSTHYAAVRIDGGARVRCLGSSVCNNYCFGAVVKGAQSLLVMRSAEEKTEQMCSAEERAAATCSDCVDCVLPEHKVDDTKLLQAIAEEKRGCHVCTNKLLPSGVKATVIHTNSKQGVLVSHSARAELSNCWIYENYLSVSGSGSSVQLHNNVFRISTSATCIKAGKGTSIDAFQNISNRQIVGIDGQCMVNDRLSSIAKDHANIMHDAHNIEPGSPRYKYPSQEVAQVIDDRMPHCTLLERGPFRKEADFKDLNFDRIRHKAKHKVKFAEEFLESLTPYEAAKLEDTFRVMPVSNPGTNPVHDTSLGSSRWSLCGPAPASMQGEELEDLEIDDNGDLVPKKSECVIA